VRTSPRSTDTVPMWRAWSWRATAWAVRSGRIRGLSTGRPPPPEVEREAGLAGGLAGAGIDVHEHLADRAAEGSGGHGTKAKNTRPIAPPQRPGQGAAGARVSPCRAEVDGAVLVWGLAGPWPLLSPPGGCSCTSPPRQGGRRELPGSRLPAGLGLQAAMSDQPGDRQAIYEATRSASITSTRARQVAMAGSISSSRRVISFSP